jgi:NTP pyrophosphatase (non-canonical NTP hydrolase)
LIDFEKFFKGKLLDIQNSFDNYQIENFPKRSPEFFCLELNGEAGELANIEKKHWKGKEITPDQFEDEAADVFIALMNYCNSRNINLEISVIRKLKHIEEKRKKLKAKGMDY